MFRTDFYVSFWHVFRNVAVVFLVCRYGEHDYLNCTAVEVPFRGGLLSLLALLPKDPAGMRLLETRLSARRLADILNSLRVDTVYFQVRSFLQGVSRHRPLNRAGRTVFWRVSVGRPPPQKKKNILDYS